MGAYIENVEYKIIPSSIEYKAFALLNDEIDLLHSSMDLESFSILDQDPDIDVYTGLGNGYWCIDINCREAPFNWTALRRAFAYSYDKSRVNADIFGGLSAPHDSIVPHANRFCIEDDLDWHYYSNRADIGNQILDDAGFEVDPLTGYRNDPNGHPMHIVIEYPPYSGTVASGCAQAGVDAFASLHISAESNQYNFNTYFANLWPRSIPRIIVQFADFSSNNVDWFGNEWWKERPAYPLFDHHFENTTYNMYLEDLFSKHSYDEVYDAAAEIQRIIHYSVPRLVICPRLFLQPYRTDRFTGLIEDINRGVPGHWSLRNIHSITGSPGGTVRIGITSWPGSLNFYRSTFSTSTFCENLWPTLFTIGPDLELIPNLAKSMKSETHIDNPFIPEGYTRLTVDMIQNATWSDGVRLTAQDVVFTTIYEIESGAYGNPAAQDHEKLVTAYSPNPFRAVFEYVGESYWYFYKQAVKNIIPKHIFNNVSGIGYIGWNTWDPVFNPEEPHVTCGPFIVDSVTEEILEMTRNPNYHFMALDFPEINTTTPQTTAAEEIPTYQTGLQPLTPNPIQLITMGISITSSAVIVDSMVRILRFKRGENN
jgi:ABC-type transport system substrate-binding protein